MKIAIKVEATKMPKPDPTKNCECMKKPVILVLAKGELIWVKDVGDFVKKGETVCEGEIDKKVVEFLSPANGVLCEKCIGEREAFTAGDILGFIETDQ